MIGYQLSKALSRYLEVMTQSLYLPGAILTLAGFWTKLGNVVPRVIEINDPNTLKQLSDQARQEVGQAINFIRDLSPSQIFPDAISLRASIEEIIRSIDAPAGMPSARIPQLIQTFSRL